MDACLGLMAESSLPKAFIRIGQVQTVNQRKADRFKPAEHRNPVKHFLHAYAEFSAMIGTEEEISRDRW